MCVASSWSLKKNSQNPPSLRHYRYIEKDYVCDGNLLEFNFTTSLSLKTFLSVWC